MNHEVLSERLLTSAKLVGWSVSREADFTAPRFRGRKDVSEVPLPESAIGLRLGAYPVLVAQVLLTDVDGMKVALRSIHNQMVIARSYMRAEEVINAHVMLCVAASGSEADWRGLVDLAERDETVCRKVAWVPDPDALDLSYDRFLARTFLAQPWRLRTAIHDAPLDHNEGLVERILVRHGLSEPAAKRWIELAEVFKGDPDGLICQLVAAWEPPK